MYKRWQHICKYLPPQIFRKLFHVLSGQTASWLLAFHNNRMLLSSVAVINEVHTVFLITHTQTHTQNWLCRTTLLCCCCSQSPSYVFLPRFVSPFPAPTLLIYHFCLSPLHSDPPSGMLPPSTFFSQTDLISGSSLYLLPVRSQWAISLLWAAP